MKKRFKFICWNCTGKYTLFKEITEQQQLIVACPYCNAEGVVDLAPFKKLKKIIIRGSTEDEQDLGYEYQFPEVIPTRKAE